MKTRAWSRDFLNRIHRTEFHSPCLLKTLASASSDTSELLAMGLKWHVIRLFGVGGRGGLQPFNFFPGFLFLFFMMEKGGFFLDEREVSPIRNRVKIGKVKLNFFNDDGLVLLSTLSSCTSAHYFYLSWPVQGICSRGWRHMAMILIYQRHN